MTGRWVARLPTWLGDTIMAMPTLRRLADALPDRLALWGPGHFEPLLAELGIRAPFIPYRRRAGVVGLGDARRAVADLRRQRFDAALLLPNAFEAALITALAGIPRRVGYATDGRGWLLTDVIAPPPAHRVVHEADRFAGLLEPLHLEAPGESAPAVPPSAEVERRAAALIPVPGDVLGLVPGAANGPAKRWPAASYGALASACAEALGARPALLGGPTDRNAAAKVQDIADVACIDLVGTDLLDLTAALCRCRVVVSNDTGAAHLAAALGRPTIVLLGPTDPHRTCPRGVEVHTVSAGCSCQPCLYQNCPLDHRCMDRLDVATVFERVVDLWQQAS
jgi:heptosyltransferase-2